MQPFDVVEELNRSVESWVSKVHPSPEEIHDVINRIGSFLLFFSRRTMACPQYRRTCIELSHLVEFQILNDVVQSMAPAVPPLLEEYYTIVFKNADPNKPVNVMALASAAAATAPIAEGAGGHKRLLDKVSRAEKKSFPIKGPVRAA